MAVMAREKWTDERLDDLNARMEKGFDEVKGEIRDLRAETKTEFHQLRGELNTRFNAMEGRFNGMETRFDSLQKTIVLGFVSMTASIVGALLVTQL
jgi:hypothetical protein